MRACVVGEGFQIEGIMLFFDRVVVLCEIVYDFNKILLALPDIPKCIFKIVIVWEIPLRVYLNCSRWLGHDIVMRWSLLSFNCVDGSQEKGLSREMGLLEKLLFVSGMIGVKTFLRSRQHPSEA